jgi:hypothetical protein
MVVDGIHKILGVLLHVQRDEVRAKLDSDFTVLVLGIRIPYTHHERLCRFDVSTPLPRRLYRSSFRFVVDGQGPGSCEGCVVVG